MVKRSVIPPVLIVLCAAALPLIFIHGGFLNTWEYLAYDVLCRNLLVEDEVSDRVALVMIDTISLDFGTEFHDQYDYLQQKGIVEGEDKGGEYGARTLFLWPWKRSAYEIIIDFLAQGGARVVAFDMVFSTPHPSGAKDSDDSLGVSTLMHNEEGSTHVIHTVNFHESEQVPENRRIDTGYERKCLEAASLRIEGIETSPFPFNRSDGGFYYAPILPYRAILEDTLEAFDGGKGLLRLGAVAVQQDPDAVIRRARVVTQYKNWNLPSLGLAAALAYMESEEGIGDVDLRVGESGLSIIRNAEGEATRIPLTPSGDILVHYKDSGLEGYEGSSRFQTYPAYRILLSAMNNTRLIEELGFDPDSFRVDPAVFKDMIVFVGANALGLYDLKATPISENYPGVKVHAAVAENLLDGDPLRRMAAPGRGLIAALLALVTILATLYLKKTAFKVLITAAVTLLYALIVVVLFTSGLLWIDMIIPLAGVVIAYTGGTTYNYFTEGRHKREITRMFQHYVPASVVNKLVRNPEDLNTKGERVELTVFFSDIRGFTTLSNTERMRKNPEILTNHLNAYLTEMTSAIHDCGGTLDKYIGDAVVAFFGAPLPMENHAREACRAALECQRRLGAFNARASEKEMPRLETRIGLYTGEAMVGNVGSDVRLSYTAIGSPVNLGSRLEGTNKAYGTWILAGEPTVLAAGADVCARWLDVVRVPGIEENAPPIKIYEIRAMTKDATDREGAMIARYDQALAGYRAGEFEKALNLFEEMAAEFKDPPSRVLANRCRHFLEHPPETWEGAFRIESK